MKATKGDFRTNYKKHPVLFGVLDRWLHKRTDSPEQQPEESQHNSFDRNSFASEIDNDLSGEPASPDSRNELPVAPWLDPGPDVIPVNLETALFYFDGDRDFMLEMRKDFRDHLPKRVEDLQSALREGDASRLTRQAHTLKGVSRIFGADYLTILAARLEELCRDEVLTEASALVGKIGKEARRVGLYLA